MVADSRRVPHAATGCGVFFDAEHFFDGYKRNPEFALRVLEAAAEQGRRATSCCATPTAARCRTRSSEIVGEVVGHFGDDVDHRHPHSTTTPAARWPTRSPRVRGGATPGAGHDQRLRRAHRQLQPHDDHPEPHAEDGHRARCPRAASSGSPPVSHHIAELVNLPLEPAGAVRRRVGVRPQGRPAHVARSPSAKDAYEHVDPDVGRQRHPLRRVASWPAGRRIEMKAKELGLELDGAAVDRGHRRAEAARARGLPLRGGRRARSSC